MGHRAKRREIKEVAWEHFLLGSTEARASAAGMKPLLSCWCVARTSRVIGDTVTQIWEQWPRLKLPPLCRNLAGFTFPEYWSFQDQRATKLEMNKTESSTAAVLYQTNQTNQQATTKPNTCWWARHAQLCPLSVSVS